MALGERRCRLSAPSRRRARRGDVGRRDARERWRWWRGGV